MKQFSGLIILAILFFICFSVHAEDNNIYHFTLKEVSELALLNNFEIQLAKYDTWISRTDKGMAKSIYDTIFDAQVKYRDNKRAQANTILGTKTIQNEYDIGLSKKLPTGTTFGIDLINQRQSSNALFSTSPVTHDSTLKATIDQDLGRNFFGLDDRNKIRLTLLDIENSEYISLDKIELSVADVQKAYWDLVLAQEQVKVTQEISDQAKRLYQHHQQQLLDGLVEEPEVIASQANYQKHQNQLLLVQNKLEIKINALRLKLNLQQEDLGLYAVDHFEFLESDIELNQAIAEAFENRRDYKKVKNDVKSKNIKLSVTKNNLWPQINLSASLAQNGLGDDFNKAVTTITEEDNSDLTAGLIVSIPLENTEARSKLKAADFEKAKALVSLKYLERKIAIEIVDQFRLIQTFKTVAENEYQIVDLQKRKLEEELKRFSKGRSDTDTIIRYQEDVLNAQLTYLESQYRYQTALIDLRLKQSTLLNEYLTEKF